MEHRLQVLDKQQLDEETKQYKPKATPKKTQDVSSKKGAKKDTELDTNDKTIIEQKRDAHEAYQIILYHLHQLKRKSKKVIRVEVPTIIKSDTQQGAPDEGWTLLKKKLHLKSIIDSLWSNEPQKANTENGKTG